MTKDQRYYRAHREERLRKDRERYYRIHDERIKQMRRYQASNAAKLAAYRHENRHVLKVAQCLGVPRAKARELVGAIDG